MITGVENHEGFTSIIKQATGDEHYQIHLHNILKKDSIQILD
jgi:hypothetical protein